MLLAQIHLETAAQALRWITAAAVPAEDGVTWPVSRAKGARLADDLYEGTAGVLVALAEARLTGFTEFDDFAAGAVQRLQSLVAANGDARTAGQPDPISPGFFDGLAGFGWVLGVWARVSGDVRAHESARAAMRHLAEIAARAQAVSDFRDLLTGEAGIALVLLGAADPQALSAANAIADRLVSSAQWDDGEPDWYTRDDIRYFLPNFSHGAAGIACSLASTGRAVKRQDLVDLAARAGRRLVRLGTRSDGTLAVPHSIPLADPAAPVSYGWCHGPTGTLRLFEALELAQPGQGWSAQAEACRSAVRRSGLPARLYPGFWDNLGQCCGTAGVGEMALDRFQDTGDGEWLDWAQALAGDLAARRISDAVGVRWSNTEHRIDPPELEPMIGWMQGAAGIAGFLLRLARVERDGIEARRISWPY